MEGNVATTFIAKPWHQGKSILLTIPNATVKAYDISMDNYYIITVRKLVTKKEGIVHVGQGGMPENEGKKSLATVHVPPKEE